jgi:hypothetical protein
VKREDFGAIDNMGEREDVEEREYGVERGYGEREDTEGERGYGGRVWRWVI